METTINYEKYSTMSIAQLVTALTNAERKQVKIQEKLKEKLNEIENLIAYLKSQIKSSIDKQRFYNTNTPKKQTTQIKIPENTEKNKNEIEVYEIDKNIIETLKYISKRKDKLSEIALSDFTRKYKKLTKIPISNEDFRNIFKDYLLFERKDRIKALKDKAIQILNNEKSNTKEQQCI